MDTGEHSTTDRDLNMKSTGRKVERKVWSKRQILEKLSRLNRKRDKENLRMFGSYSHKLCLYYSYGVIV
jgi:hypothetical protein